MIKIDIVIKLKIINSRQKKYENNRKITNI